MTKTTAKIDEHLKKLNDVLENKEYLHPNKTLNLAQEHHEIENEMLDMKDVYEIEFLEYIPIDCKFGFIKDSQDFYNYYEEELK